MSIAGILAPASCRWASRDEVPRLLAMTLSPRENLVDKGFSDSSRAACYQPYELRHSRFEEAGVQEWGNSTKFFQS
jgi:hypothetical protein